MPRVDGRIVPETVGESIDGKRSLRVPRCGDTNQSTAKRRPDQDRLDPNGVLPPQVLHEHVGDEVHARPLLLEEIGDDGDLQRHHEPATSSSKNSTCRRATTDQANSVRARRSPRSARSRLSSGSRQHASQRCRPRLDIVFREKDAGISDDVRYLAAAACDAPERRTPSLRSTSGRTAHAIPASSGSARRAHPSRSGSAAPGRE